MMRRVKPFALAFGAAIYGAGNAASAATVDGGLLETAFSVEVQFQPDAGSERQALSFEDTQTVGAGVEFPSLAALLIADNPFDLRVVDVSVDVGDDFIDIDFDNAQDIMFADGFFNGYRFAFDSTVPVDILSASFDETLTTFDFDDGNLEFLGNMLFLNVAGLGFTQESFIRINIDAIGGPTADIPVAEIPIPGALALMMTGLAGLA